MATKSSDGIVMEAAGKRVDGVRRATGIPII